MRIMSRFRRMAHPAIVARCLKEHIQARGFASLEYAQAIISEVEKSPWSVSDVHSFFSSSGQRLFNLAGNLLTTKDNSKIRQLDEETCSTNCRSSQQLLIVEDRICVVRTLVQSQQQTVESLKNHIASLRRELEAIYPGKDCPVCSHCLKQYRSSRMPPPGFH